MKPHLYLECYLKRWHLIPRNRWFNVYLHRFEGSDTDRALHDHPWWSLSVLLRGELTEVLPVGSRKILPFWPYLRAPEATHRMLLDSDSAWTLFITGPKQRAWGFYTPEGWVHNEDFL